MAQPRTCSSQELPGGNARALLVSTSKCYTKYASPMAWEKLWGIERSAPVIYAACGCLLLRTQVLHHVADDG